MKTIQEINEKIRRGEAVVFTAEEIADFTAEQGVEKAAQIVDVVTTATFGPMCSSGIYFNTGHSNPKIKLGGGKVTLNGIPCYAGFAAADLFLGANALAEDDPKNRVYPGEFSYGGGHVINDLVSGKELVLEAFAYGTDCYPRKHLLTGISIKDLNEAVLFNMRNCYQNYDVAVNTSERPLYTYMGILKPDLGNATYCSAGALSPLLNDPYYRTIGIGTKIFLGGDVGFVSWWGTQHNPCVERTDKGIPIGPAGTLALIGDLKKMSPEWLIGASMYGYGVTLSVGVGIPIPVLNQDILLGVCSRDKDIYTRVVDYSSVNSGSGKSRVLATVNYEELKSGKIIINGREVPTGTLSSLRKAREIAGILKQWIKEGRFTLTGPVASIPSADSGYELRPLKEKPLKDD